MSERLGAFLEDDPRQRLKLYAETKKAYGIRSVVVHGTVVKPSKRKQVVSASEHLDSCLRRSFRRILTDPIARTLVERSKYDFDDYFMYRVFSARWQDFVDKEET